MRVAGIVAEYNPLHNGHIYHLTEAQRKSGASYVVVVMSGNFVQRGEPACTDKFTRAQWALEAGADIVLELPCVFANAGAEDFASGAVRLLNATGVVTDLAFGCEQSSLSVLEELADITVSEPPEFKRALRDHLNLGKSYPRARYDALRDIGVRQEMLEELTKPNNILAVEYIRALKQISSKIVPLPIERIGGGYSESVLTGEYSSAAAIRDAVRRGDSRVLEALPMFISGAMQFDPQFPVSVNDVGAMMLYQLRQMPLEDIASLKDIGEGMESLVASAARKCCDAETFFEAIKSKRYTMARCKRLGMSALLNLTEELAESMRNDKNLYFRVLGMRRSARALLSAIAALSPCPIIMRHSDLGKCTESARESLAVDAFSTDILSYALQKNLHRDSESAVLL